MNIRERIESAQLDYYQEIEMALNLWMMKNDIPCANRRREVRKFRLLIYPPEPIAHTLKYPDGTEREFVMRWKVVSA